MPTGCQRVLVIEDDQAIRELLTIVLAAEGYDIRVATNGREGLVMVDQWRPHLVLLDLLMRDMDGWTFRAEQRRHGLADIPVLILTGAGDPDAQAEALAAPVLHKPFELDELLRSVQGLVN